MSLEKLITDPSPLQVSFEFSPPKTDEAEETLWKAIRRLEPLSPSFVSVTYGAGGSTRERTHATVKRIVDETSLKPAAPLTCVGHPRGEIGGIGQGYWESGIRHIVALRGDMPDMSGPYCPHAEGFASTPISSWASGGSRRSRSRSRSIRRCIRIRRRWITMWTF